MRTTIHRLPVSHNDHHFGLVIALMLACALTTGVMTAFAQTPDSLALKSKATNTPAKADDAKPKAPEAVTLSADAVKALQDTAKDARIAQLEYENLGREIELAKTRLEKLADAAKKAQESSNEAFILACTRAGIPINDVKDYQGEINEKGEMVLRRKAPAPPPTPPPTGK